MQLNLPSLNFPSIDFNMKISNGKVVVFDPCRRKFVPLTPEEWVRQHCIGFLHQIKEVPLSLISVEKLLKINNQPLRYDIVIYSKSGKPLLLVECKAPQVAISRSTFDQIAVYNLELKVPFLFVSNGMDHYFCTFELNQKKPIFIKELPNYQTMMASLPPDDAG